MIAQKYTHELIFRWIKGYQYYIITKKGL